MEAFLALLFTAFIIAMFVMGIYGMYQAITHEKVSGLVYMWLAYQTLHGEMVTAYFKGLLGN